MSDEKKKSGLDERTFGKLLEAAYLLQEHNRQVRQMEKGVDADQEQTVHPQPETEKTLTLKSGNSAEERSRIIPDYAVTLAEIVETQRQVQIRHLDVDQAMALVCESAVRFAAGSGAAVATAGGENHSLSRLRGNSGASLRNRSSPREGALRQLRAHG